MSEKQNIVFIARSIDGYISDKNDDLAWLDIIPGLDGVEMGYTPLMERIDGIVMGRKSFEVVLGFGIEWPYTKPVFVLSTTLKTIPKNLEGKVELVNGSIPEVLDQLHQREFLKLYIDGGTTIQSFLKEDLIDEMIITTIPILLGGGAPLFGELPKTLRFDHVKSEVFLDQVIQDHYARRRS
ncbi:MAG: dihydrofolate reductase [Cyclobacteriaceae bacterium]